MPLGQVKHLGDFCFGHFERVDSAETNTLLVDVQHDPGRLLARAVEATLQDVDDEFHRRVVWVTMSTPMPSPSPGGLPIGDRGEFGSLIRTGSGVLLMGIRYTFL